MAGDLPPTRPAESGKKVDAAPRPISISISITIAIAIAIVALRHHCQGRDGDDDDDDDEDSSACLCTLLCREFSTQVRASVPLSLKSAQNLK